MEDGKNQNKTLTAEEIKEILDTGDFDRLISQRESEIFEAKLQKPYDFTQGVKTKIEFVKDVISLANKNGGYIVCGLDTPKNRSVPHDIVSGIFLQKQTDFYRKDDLIKIVNELSSPQVEIDVKWFSSKEDKALGLGVIIIPPQKDKKYFFLKLSEMNGKIQKDFFCVPIRTDDDIKWLTVKELYQLSKRFPNDWQEGFLNLSSQLEEIKNSISISQAISASAVDIDSIPAKIEETING